MLSTTYNQGDKFVQKLVARKEYTRPLVGGVYPILEIEPDEFERYLRRRGVSIDEVERMLDGLGKGKAFDIAKTLEEYCGGRVHRNSPEDRIISRQLFFKRELKVGEMFGDDIAKRHLWHPINLGEYAKSKFKHLYYKIGESENVLYYPTISFGKETKGWKINYFPKFENWHTLFFMKIALYSRKIT